MTTIIVYGSAADPRTRRGARDVDVAYTGAREAAEPIVAKWAAAHGLTGLPVDWHPARVRFGKVVLPAPYGQKGAYQVLAGEDRVDWSPEYGLAAAIRAFEGRKLRRELSRKGTWLRVAVIPDPRALDPERTYVEGLTAVRNAVAKRPDARQVLEKLWPSVFPRLLDEDPRPTSEGLRILRNGSPGSGGDEVSIVLTEKGVRLQYMKDVDVAALLFPGR